MNGLIPSIISEQYCKNHFKGTLQATTMFIDIAGFSAMTQALMKNGKEGAEVLAGVINHVFTPAIKIIYEHRGFVSTFAGDAFTSVFPSDSVTVTDALSAAVRLQELFRKNGNRKTKFGSFSLSVRISLSHGSVSWGIIPHESQNAFHFGGQAVKRCTKCGNHTFGDEIVFDGKVLSQIADMPEADYRQINDRCYSLNSIPSTDTACISETIEPASHYSFIPREVLSLQRKGEFRDIVSCYMSFEKMSDLEKGVSSIISLAHGFGGYFNKIDFKYRGGMMLVLFGAPVNPGNLYNRALDFALAVQKQQYCSVRTGLAYGTVFAGFVGSDLRSEYTALGSVVNLSARFTQQKERSAIYVDESIYRQCQSRYEIQELKPREFKGFKGKIPVFRLAGKKKSIQVSAFDEHMIGRESELTRLAEYMQPVKEGRFAGIVNVYGRPGIGKSRLVYEFTKRQKVRTLILQTDSILRKPLNPFAYFFNNYFDQSEEGSADDRKATFDSIYQELIGRIVSLSDIEKRVETIKELNRVKSVIGSIIGLYWEDSVYDTIASEDRAVVTRLAIKEFLKALSLVEPLIVLIEDIQWLDDESQEAFEILTRKVAQYPIIVLTTSRFNDDGSRPELKLDEDVPCHSIKLEDLSSDNARLLIEDRLGSRTDSDLAAYIFTRTEGNPFYTEQFCLYLRENDLIRVDDGMYHLIGKPVDIPTDINMILIARIDRLSEKLKETVQIASVLGREFELQVLSALMEFLHSIKSESGTAPPAVGIAEMVTRVEEEGIWSALSELKYIFNHALLRDAAYDMQLRTRLRDLHSIAGDVIVKLHHDDRAFYADTAHHYELAEEWEKAGEFCQKAGDYFYELVKYEEALIYRRKSLTICLKALGEKHPDTALSYFNLGLVNSDMGNYKNALTCYDKALTIRRDILGETSPETAQSYSNIGEVHAENGDYDNALENHNKALAIRKNILGEQHPDTACSYNDIGAVYQSRNEYDTALEYYKKALAIEEETLGENHQSKACSYNNIGHVHSVKGDYDEALAYYEKALTIQKETLSEKHPHTATLYNNIGSVYCKMGDYDNALDYIEKAHSIQKELLGEKHPSTARSYNNIGAIYLRKGNYDIALAYYEKAHAIRKELLGVKHPDTVNSYNNIGLAYWRKGDYDKALHYCGEALAIKQDLFGDRHPNTAMSLKCIATIYASQGKFGKAEQLFKEAYAILRESLGEIHPLTVTTLQQMAAMYEDMGNEMETGLIREQLKRIAEE